jgi:hypothetical protein
MMEDAKEGAAPEGAAPPKRQPYEKPAVAWEESLEVRPNLMAGCGKVPGEGAQCDTAPGS